MSNCNTCGKILDPITPGAYDCGGDCSECMIRAGDYGIALQYLKKLQEVDAVLTEFSKGCTNTQVPRTSPLNCNMCTPDALNRINKIMRGYDL